MPILGGRKQPVMSFVTRTTEHDDVFRLLTTETRIRAVMHLQAPNFATQGARPLRAFDSPLAYALPVSRSEIVPIRQAPQRGDR